MIFFCSNIDFFVLAVADSIWTSAVEGLFDHTDVSFILCCKFSSKMLCNLVQVWNPFVNGKSCWFCRNRRNHLGAASILWRQLLHSNCIFNFTFSWLRSVSDLRWILFHLNLWILKTKHYIVGTFVKHVFSSHKTYLILQ